MILTSPSFEDGAEIPSKFTCEGGDINPELQVQNVPEGAKSLALIMHDPDAPREGGFAHWVMWNIKPTTTLIKEESVPPGSMEGLHGAGKQGYIGPCPPSGKHHYEFRLYALDAALAIPEVSVMKDLEDAMRGHIIEETLLTGLYEKQKK
jgi:Raf kinase inhibitor-like YbhB/YbcL family protein